MSSSSSSSSSPPPEDRTSKVSSLCSLGMRPQLMTGVLRQLLMQHFADKDNLEEQALRAADADLHDFLWRADDTTGIVIDSVTRWDPGLVERRPAVILKRNSWQNVRMGIGDRHMGMAGTNGQERYSTFMAGSHTLFCIATEGAETELLAAEVYRTLITFSPEILKSMQLHRFTVMEVSSLSKLQEATDRYVAAVTVAYAHEESWQLNLHGPVLKRLVFQTQLFQP